MTSVDGYGSGSIITPEAVVLNFELAGLGSRALAYAVDLLVQLAALFALAFILGLVAVGSDLAALIMLLVGVITIVLGYPTAMETLAGGRTLGRMIVKTRVVTVEGAPVRFRHAFLRALLGIVDLLATAGGVAVVSSLLTRRGQRLGDLVAGTMVIRESTAFKGNALHFWAPHYLEQWAQTVETRGLGHDTYQLVRDFLTRTDLAEPHRSAVAEELCVLVSERLPHAAKTPAVPALDYLTAIATATQDGGAVPPPPPMVPRPAPAPAATASAVAAAPVAPPAVAPPTNDGGFAAPG